MNKEENLPQKLSGSFLKFVFNLSGQRLIQEIINFEKKLLVNFLKIPLPNVFKRT